MNKLNDNVPKDVKDLRQTFKNSNRENMFKKTLLFGYDVSETNQYISSLEANRELEKTAFLDRIKELEQLIKTLQSERDEWESSLDNIKKRMEDYEAEIKDKNIKLRQNDEQINQCENLIQQYENKLKEREDAVVLKENINLKEQLSITLNERNDYAGQCEVLKNQNTFYENKVDNLEGEVNMLTEKLSEQIKTAREYIAGISLQITKITESHDFLGKKAITSLEDMLYYYKNQKTDTDDLTKKLKETISSINI